MARIVRWITLVLACTLVGCEARNLDPSTPPAAQVLNSSLAGSWYPANADRLRRDLDQYLSDAEAESRAGVHALIQPHAGYTYSGTVAAHGMRALGTNTFRRVVVIGPSHRHPLPNQVSLPDATHYGTPLGQVPLDTEFMNKLLKDAAFVQAPGVHDHEHSVQIQVPLLQHVLGDFKLVPLVVGSLDLDTTRHVASQLRRLVGSNTLVVASTDFTHYGPRFGYVPFTDDIPANLRALDMGAWDFIEKKDAEGFKDYCKRTGATVCGRTAVGVLLEMLAPEDELALLGYDTSGRMLGNFQDSVSYLSAAAIGSWPHEPEAHLSHDEQQALLKLARDTLVFRFREGRMPEASELQFEPTPAMKEKSGAFVTLTKQGALRGCIGDLAAANPLYQTVMQYVVTSALRDTRFQPVREEELSELAIEISALTPMRPVDSYLDFEPGKHGILLKKGWRHAVYLPQVAPEQGWDREQTLAHLARKAGLPADGWKSGARFEVFEALVFGEEE